MPAKARDGRRTILEVDCLRVVFGGETVLRDLSVDVWRGHIHALVGPNGTGKSTLAHAIMSLEAYHHAVTGSIGFEGEPITDWDIHERASRGITLAWQEPARFGGLTVERYLTAGSRWHGGSPAPGCGPAGRGARSGTLLEARRRSRR